MSFTYCECPDCEYSVVIADADLAGGYRMACTICEEDCHRLVPMTMRPARDSDRPEGVDARKSPMPKFTCSGCGNECLSPVSEEQAATEFEIIHGMKADPNRHPTICDDCFQATLPGGRRQ